MASTGVCSIFPSQDVHVLPEMSFPLHRLRTSNHKREAGLDRCRNRFIITAAYFQRNKSVYINYLPFLYICLETRGTYTVW